MILLLQLLLALYVQACDCTESKIEDNFAASDIIATVKARSATELETIQVWKGGKKLKDFTVKGGSSDCDYSFTEGEKYLVFAKREKGSYVSNLCSGNKPLALANKDILWLKLRGLKK